MIANSMLIADDEPDLAAFVGRVAAGCGYKVTLCSDPQILAERVCAFEGSHIVLDLMMPGLDGIQVLRQLAQARCRAKILIFSSANPKILEAARRFGIESGLDMAGTLCKPARAAELRAVLEQMKRDADWLTVSAVQTAIDNGELYLEYQPKVDVKAGTLCGAEALVRWAHPVRGSLSPGVFLPLAESEGLIDRITAFVFITSVGQVAAWRRRGFECPVSINLSSRSLHDLDLPDRLSARCDEMGVPPSLITLELTETAAMEDGTRGIDILTRLRLKGFELSIDDFGTGYSSLVQLHRLPFCELKLDCSFVRECATNRDALVIVRAMTDLAHNLGLRACAEGVETEAVAETLLTLGCDSIQGFHIARPMRAERLPVWAQEHAARTAAGKAVSLRQAG
ncbi:MAG: EAL domain-containing response regulator [Rhodospirillaceae bacterium]|nr:EAL domain-containing response regulator [Rhodospirillaceae bacterium]